jgi:ribosomal protein L11 methyltransferase
MTWWQFSLNCQASELEQIEDLMLTLGALSISLSDAGDEPIYEPLPGDNPVWRESIVTATFDAATGHENLYQQLITELPDHLASGVRQTILRNQDWDQAYKQHFQPLQCAPNLWVVPSWSEPPDPEATIIHLDPGLAFGTGSHPTTALCLAWLAAYQIEGRRVIDFGCGSGILAIAAIKLGAKQVTAVDIDQQALAACKSNMKVNQIKVDQIRVAVGIALDALVALIGQQLCILLVLLLLLLRLLDVRILCIQLVESHPLDRQIDMMRGVKPPTPEPVQIHSGGVLHRSEEIRRSGPLEHPAVRVFLEGEVKILAPQDRFGRPH